MIIAILDTNGAGLGQNIIKKFKKEFSNDINIIALGTNTFATSKMVKAGAHIGVSGEKAICYFCKKNEVNCIIAPIGVLCNGEKDMELCPSICKAIINMNCTKYILPLQKYNIYIPGTRNLQIKDFIDEIISDIKNKMVIS